MWQTVFDGSLILGIAGGIVATVRGWTSMQKGLKSLEEKLTTCQAERIMCRKSIMDHHDARAIHRDPERDERRWDDLVETIDKYHTDFDKRMDRLESIVLRINGGRRSDA